VFRIDEFSILQKSTLGNYYRSWFPRTIIPLEWIYTTPFEDRLQKSTPLYTAPDNWFPIIYQLGNVHASRHLSLRMWNIYERSIRVLLPAPRLPSLDSSQPSWACSRSLVDSFLRRCCHLMRRILIMHRHLVNTFRMPRTRLIHFRTWKYG
jgi:hypothetical protein